MDSLQVLRPSEVFIYPNMMEDCPPTCLRGLPGEGAVDGLDTSGSTRLEPAATFPTGEGGSGGVTY